MLIIISILSFSSLLLSVVVAIVLSYVRFAAFALLTLRKLRHW